MVDYQEEVHSSLLIICLVNKRILMFVREGLV